MSEDSSRSSKRSVIWALCGNSSVMCLKFVAAGLTGSSAMLAEGLHSAGDVINQIALYLGIKQGSKKPDQNFPFGYGRARYLWNCVAALLVALLAGITLYKGISTIFYGHVPDYISSDKTILSLSVLNFELSITPVMIALLILAASLLVEGYTLLIAKRVVWRQKGSCSFIKYIRETSDPTGIAVFLEDLVAELGVSIAIAGILVTMFTRSPLFDGIAALVIALMMFGVAILMIYLNGILLIGKSDSEIEVKIKDLIGKHPIVERVHRVHTQIFGSNIIFAVIWVEFREEVIYEHVANGASKKLTDKSPRQIVDVTYNHIAKLTDELRRYIKEYLPNVLFICIEAETPRIDKDSSEARILNDAMGIHAQTV